MLSFKLVAKFAFFASLASSSPLTHVKRTDPGPAEVAVASKEVIADIGVLNFALSLEHLEHQFYLDFLHRFGEQDFRRANIPNPTQTFQNFHHILQHEAQHVKTLQTVITSLGGTPLPPCEYNFGVEDVQGYMGLARKLEKVGVSAYDGAVALLNSPDLQTAAATIDTVEARHSSFIATSTGVDPFPEDFDVPLGGDQIITLASAVILKCPFDIKTTLGAAPAASLSLVAPHVVRAGREIKVKFDPGQNKPDDHFCSFMFSDKSVVVPLSSEFKCKVPRGCRGDIFVAILNKNEKLTLKNSVGIIAAGPIIVNVDSSIEDSCKKFVHGVDFEWKAYDLKHDKAYDVDEEIDISAAYAYKSNDQSEWDANKANEHSEVDAWKDQTQYETSNDHTEVDASDDQTEYDTSNDHTEVDASEDHDTSTDHTEVDTLKDTTEYDASNDHIEVTSDSKDSQESKGDSTPRYQKRGLTSPYSSHAELPLWSPTPSPADVPAALESGDGTGDYGAGTEISDAQPAEWHGAYDDMAVEIDDAEDENNDMVHDNTENSDMENDNTESNGMGHGDTEEGDGMKNNDMNHGESADILDVNSGAEAAAEDNNPITVAVYGSPDEAATPPPVVDSADVQVPDSFLPNRTGEPGATESVIDALRMEVAQAQDEDGWEEVKNVAEVEEEPQVEADGPELETPDSDLEDADSESETQIEGDTESNLTDTKIALSDASDAVADLEAQLQKIESQPLV